MGAYICFTDISCVFRGAEAIWQVQVTVMGSQLKQAPIIGSLTLRLRSELAVTSKASEKAMCGQFDRFESAALDL